MQSLTYSFAIYFLTESIDLKVLRKDLGFSRLFFVTLEITQLFKNSLGHLKMSPYLDTSHGLKITSLNLYFFPIFKLFWIFMGTYLLYISFLFKCLL